MRLANNEEEVLWQSTVIAYVNSGGKVEKGSHLKFADRVVEALRKRQNVPVVQQTTLAGLHQYKPRNMAINKFSRIVHKAVHESPSRIPAIKQVREHTGLGLRESKLAVELYAEAHPNPLWKW